MIKKNILIVGPGKVGTTFAMLAESIGFKEITLAGRSQNSLDIAKKHLSENIFRFCLIDELSAKAIVDAEIICIATQDNKISDVQTIILEKLEGETKINENAVVFHFSGHKSSQILDGLSKLGFHIGSLHPLKSISDSTQSFKTFAGTYCAIEGDSYAQEGLTDFVNEIHGIPIRIESEHKPLYHAAAVIACNYSITLYDIAMRIYMKIGLDEETARKLLVPLLKGTISNFEKLGTPNALTGPIERGDSSTITEHIQAIQQNMPDLIEFYKLLGKQTLKVAKDKGLSQDATNAINDAIET